MILLGNQRGGAKGLAMHLLKDENEHVEVHEIRGFASETLPEALNEAYAISRGTKCKQFLYSLSLNPPPDENVKIDIFEAAIDRVETKLGLSGQPRATVFHTKEGPGGIRRHAHTVWSRIKTDEMKAVQLSYPKKKLRDVSRELYLEHGWKMPRGFVNSKERCMKNFTLAEWQQAKRARKDPREIKQAFQDAWAISDSGPAFVQALAARGYKVARGDKRAFVGIDERGEVYSLARQASVKTKDVRARLGDPERFPGVNVTKDLIAREMLPALQEYCKKLNQQTREQITAINAQKAALIQSQRNERSAFLQKLETRNEDEARQRQARFRSGLRGLWDRLRGEHNRIAALNEGEAGQAQIRDKVERDEFTFRQINQRRELSQQRSELKERYIEQRRDIARDKEAYLQMRQHPQPKASRPDPQRKPPASSPDGQRRAFIEQRQEQPEQMPQIERTPKPGHER